MKNIIIILLIIICTSFKTFGQDSKLIKIKNWLTENKFAIRQTFDGSKNENKPASLSYHENYKTENDFINVDLAIKLSELELLKNKNAILIFYPKVEWHKSNDSTDVKNKLEGGINFEFIPFRLKSPNLPSDLPNKGLKISPWFQGTSSYKRNFINKVYETNLAFQLSLVSNYKFLPGYSFKDKKDNFRGRYYPYLGIEYNHLPDLITKDVTEEFSTYFIRLYTEVWIFPETLQLNIDGTYREIIQNDTLLKKSLPFLSSSIYLYPGKQESLGIGFEYNYGYDTNSKFQLVQISSIKLVWKI
ncbi:hypothetical protein SD960_07785 [Flavobacterium sp. MMLR14_040]|uniref:hypothetical protein n=1 Tax=Flavobacterium sp. MMLR14_040 TaxID=3093843 RepID=UPI00298F7EAA|nr:hypothetical protein [Flavobacterium sp. MMLR14_040]MDW8849986.1 hypothetical protein [Flavobacterium sp. MMLR14_040]